MHRWEAKGGALWVQRRLLRNQGSHVGGCHSGSSLQMQKVPLGVVLSIGNGVCVVEAE